MFDYDSKENMTDAQRKVMDQFYAGMYTEVERCVNNAREALVAQVKLGTLNERGTKVTHGCNLQVNSVAQYWISRVRLIAESHLKAFAHMSGFRDTSEMVRSFMSLIALRK